MKVGDRVRIQKGSVQVEGVLISMNASVIVPSAVFVTIVQDNGKRYLDIAEHCRPVTAPQPEPEPQPAPCMALAIYDPQIADMSTPAFWRGFAFAMRLLQNVRVSDPPKPRQEIIFTDTPAPRKRRRELSETDKVSIQERVNREMAHVNEELMKFWEARRDDPNAPVPEISLRGFK